jgi:1-pyrroline-5-carboxylate dehydrogenase
MGGKNPTVISAKADLDLAADGVMRSAFGFTGQKCSACSRVYVERAVADEFTAKLAERAAKVQVGDPVDRDVYMGPVIDKDAVERFRQAVAAARRDGKVVAGGEVLDQGGVPPGNYVAPTVVTGLPADHRLLADELFVPFVAVHPVDSLDEGLKLANDTDYGLTAGFYSRDQDEVDRSSARSRPAWSTSTAAPAPPPGPGRACSRSAAGRARAAPARPAAACTTCSSSCASSPRRW